MISQELLGPLELAQLGKGQVDTNEVSWVEGHSWASKDGKENHQAWKTPSFSTCAGSSSLSLSLFFSLLYSSASIFVYRYIIPYKILSI
jgi:hypothetical protein